MSAPLLQFKAGRCERQGDSNTVSPQPGRGLVYLQEEDGLLHFYYKDLDANAIVDDLIIFPGDATFERATDRVHVLKFSSSSARHFFWHQDVDLAADEFARRGDRANELIGAEGPHDAGDMDVEAAPAADDVFMSDAPSTSAAPRLASSSSAAPFETPAAPRTEPSTAPGAPKKALGNAEQMAQLQNILASLGGGAGGGAGGAMGGSAAPEFALTDVLPAPVATSLLSSLPPSSLSHLSSFLPASPTTLPTSSPSAQQSSLARALRSPEYRRALAALDRALRTGATGPLVQGLGMRERAALGTEEFLEEVQRMADEEKAREEGGEGAGGAGGAA
ncbi:proteasome regulatory particle lid subunit RPN13 [Rhodotorula paludigena]|uniref:proteasome regulatory particle lid subunit RPN13 n=1 Tax=Rhodotorula paludigena TaxID=86838 RepID=UPI00316DE627